MREKLIGALIGLFIGFVLSAMLYNFYVSANPQATDTDKGLILLLGLFVTVGLGGIGFEIGGDP